MRPAEHLINWEVAVKTILQTTLGTIACMALLMVPAVAATQKAATDTHNETTASTGDFRMPGRPSL